MGIRFRAEGRKDNNAEPAKGLRSFVVAQRYNCVNGVLTLKSDGSKRKDYLPPERGIAREHKRKLSSPEIGSRITQKKKENQLVPQERVLQNQGPHTGKKNG